MPRHLTGVRTLKIAKEFLLITQPVGVKSYPKRMPIVSQILTTKWLSGCYEGYTTMRFFLLFSAVV